MRVIIKFKVNLSSPNLLEFKSFTFSLFFNCPEIFLRHRHFLFSVNWMKNVFLILSHFDNNYRPQPKFAKVMFSQVFVCPQGGGISVQGGFCPGGLYLGGLCPGGLCPQWGLYPVGYLSGGSLWVSLMGLCLGGLCPGGSLSREGVSVQGRGLCLGRGSLSREGSLSRALCPGWVSVQGSLCPVASLSRGSLSGRSPQYGNVRAVCIPLECILVLKIFSTCKYLRNMISETSQNKHNHFTRLITLSINLFNFESRPTPNF